MGFYCVNHEPEVDLPFDLGSLNKTKNKHKKTTKNVYFQFIFNFQFRFTWITSMLTTFAQQYRPLKVLPFCLNSKLFYFSALL